MLLLAASAAGVLITRIGDAQAHAPHEGLNFAIGIDTDGDGIDDCNTDTADAMCWLTPGTLFKVRLYVVSNGGVEYYGYDATLDYRDVVAAGTADGMTDPGTWPHCEYFAINARLVDRVGVGCASLSSSSYEGPLVTVDFICAASGSVSLVHGKGETDLVDSEPHAETYGAAETLTIEGCGVAPTRTPTPTTTATLTPTITPTPEPVTPTPTRQGTGLVPVCIPLTEDACGATPICVPGPCGIFIILTSTPTPTSTATPTVTLTPEPATPMPTDGGLLPVEVPIGDVDDDGLLTSADAGLILQYVAGVASASELGSGFLTAADVLADGKVDSLDALIALQIEAGLVSS